MTETILLVILGIVLTLIIFAIRRIVQARKVAALGKRVELLIRLALMFVAALIAHTIFSVHRFDGLTFWLSVASNALILYAISHISDRIILGE